MSRGVVNAVISAITDCLGREEKVTLVGFGTFQVMEKKALIGFDLFFWLLFGSKALIHKEFEG